jgi:hypothetical protein
LSWRRGVECAVEVLGRGSGAIKEVRKRELRGVPRAAGGRRNLDLGLLLLLGRMRRRLLWG